MTQQWWMISGDGQWRQVVTDGCSPADAGEDLTGKTATPMARKGDLNLEIPNLSTGEWSDNLEVIKAELISKIDTERELEQMKFLTEGSAKKMTYTQKCKEVSDYNSMTAAELEALSTEELQNKFPASMAEVALGDTSLAEVISKIQVAASFANQMVYRLEALSQLAKQSLRAATSLQEANEAADIDWTV